MLYKIRLPLKPNGSLKNATLESITNNARMTSTEFLGMGFAFNEIILTYESKPMLAKEIKELIVEVLNADGKL